MNALLAFLSEPRTSSRRASQVSTGLATSPLNNSSSTSLPSPPPIPPSLAFLLPKPIAKPKKLNARLLASLDEELLQENDPLTVGIYFHERQKFDFSAYFFSKSAAAGDPTGLFLFAVAKRHGWGVEKDEKEAFRLLSLVTDSVGLEQNMQSIGANNQIPLALYEVGMSFLQGWGVEKDKKKAAYYFKQAASLGDPDAQVAMGECFLRGDGVKENKKLAATWFRKAESQGARLVQMQWIWKEKYNP